MLIKALHIILALNVLFSSTGLTAFEHLCRMKGRTASLFIPSQNCCEKKRAAEVACHKTKCCSIKEAAKNASFERKPCCEDKSQFFKLKTNVTEARTLPVSDFNIQPLFAGAIFSDAGFHIFPFNQKTLRFYQYKPPPLNADIRALIQSFLC
jgi:hypothetical protein